MNNPVFIHPQAIVELGARIGEKTRVWAFVHVLSGAEIGMDCNICDHVFIENDVRIGDRVTIKCGVWIWDGITLEDDVFVGPNVTFNNDSFPRSKQYLETFPKTVVRQGASIGSNAMVGAGAVVTRDVPPNAVVVGNPARIKGYVSADRLQQSEPPRRISDSLGLKVKSVQIVKLPLITDLRGSLSFAEYDQHLPFDPKRYFLVFDVPSAEVRGEHAHRELHQFLVCLKGSCSVVLDDGENRDEVILDQPNLGLYLPPMIWATQYRYTRDAVLLVLASDVYKAEDYIRDYDEYLRLMKT